MGLFRSKKQSRGKQRVEPQLFSSRGRGDGKKSARPARRRSVLGRLFRFAFSLSLLGAFGLAAIFGYIWFTLNENGLLKIPDREPGLMVLASDGTVLAEQGAFNGDEARLADLPDYVPNAVIAIEDRRFYSHYGVDPIGLLRAAYTNYRSGRLVQGGSTLTQQLAKNLFLSPDRTIQRKLQEVVLAVWLETKFTKEEILQLYLNRVYFGSGATGIEKAARTYYQKSASELSIMEAATLAGVLKAPSSNNPAANPEAAADRARLVVMSMADAGFIDQDEASDMLARPAEVKASNYVPAKQYVVDWVNEQLPEFVKDYEQSLVIETTIDPKLQANAEKTLRKRLYAEGAKMGASEGAIVVLDGSGAVRAMVGGKSYKRSQFNRATKAKRQPGSAFKPFLYLAALEQGFTPDSVEVDEPVRIGDWEPENYRKKYLGPVTLQKALAMSLNTIAAKLVVQVGPERVGDVAHRLGITSPLGKDASIALGTSEVTPLEMTAAFAPFANGGYPVVPFAVTRILTRDGKVVYERNGSGFPQAISPWDLGALNRMMRAVITDGTGTKAAFPGADIAGKTGTSQDYRDAWFIGYSSDLIAGVWVGNDDNSPTRKVTGGSIPAEIWRDVMAPAHAGLSPRPLPGEDGAGEPTTISQVEVPDNGQFEEPRMENDGFFESLFGRPEKKKKEKEKRKSTYKAFEERAQRAQSER
jgi:penicillin-binding protein 1A